MANARKMQFTDGEGLVSADLNNLQEYMMAQGLSYLLDSAAFSAYGLGWSLGLDPNSIGLSYRFGAPFVGALCTAHSFTVAPTGTRAVSITPGILITQDSAAAFNANLEVNKRLLAVSDLSYVVNGAGSIVTTASAAANASGSDRWDILQATIAPVVEGSVSRDFKDAGTGVVTSVAQNKRTAYAITFSIKTGTGGLAGEVGKGPAPDAGYVKLAAMRLLNAGVSYTEVHDFHVPIGVLSQARSVASMNYIAAAGAWAVTAATGAVTVGAAANRLITFPCGTANTPRTRVAEIGLDYTLNGAATIKIGRYDMSTATFTSLYDVTSLATITGVRTATRFYVGDRAIWTHGRTGQSDASAIGLGNDEILAVEIHTGAAAGSFFSVGAVFLPPSL